MQSIDLAEWLGASDCQCQSRNSTRFNPSILPHREKCGAAEEAVLNTGKYFF
jgi:hypothetical protein